MDKEVVNSDGDASRRKSVVMAPNGAHNLPPVRVMGEIVPK